VISPYGNTLVQTDERIQMEYADLDLERLAQFRAKFPVMQDADRWP
jgi:predicted amidohydrolase